MNKVQLEIGPEWWIWNFDGTHYDKIPSGQAFKVGQVAATPMLIVIPEEKWLMVNKFNGKLALLGDTTHHTDENGKVTHTDVPKVVLEFPSEDLAALFRLTHL